MSLFGWTLCAIGVFALLALLITSGDIRDHTAGTGERRITRRGQLAAQRKRIAELEQQIACCPTCTPQEPGFPTIEEIAASDRSDPAPTISAPAPVDNGCRDTPLAAAETARDMTLTQIAIPGEEQMAAELDAMRAEVRARSEADTQQIRLPDIPDRPPVTDPVEVALNTPAPPPGAGASEISMAAGLAAVTKVHATVTTTD